MAEEPRFDYGAILKAVGIIAVITGVFGFAVPAIATLAFKLGHTGRAAGHEAFQWAFWALAWGLTIWQGSVMLKQVHDKIIDDMLVTAIVTAVVLLIIRVAINLIYDATKANGEFVELITGIDTGGAIVLLVVAIIAARINKF